VCALLGRQGNSVAPMHHQLTSIMCKSIAELCVECDYYHAHITPCSEHDAFHTTKYAFNKHMSETKDRSTNELLFLLCRNCVPSSTPESIEKLDETSAPFIVDIVNSIKSDNAAPVLLIKDKEKSGKTVRVMT
jgi:hypothetical protein